jgi:hypothetical protein
MKKTSRRATALLMLIVFLAGLIPIYPARAQSGQVTVTINEGVLPEDEMYVREGIRLAQDYFAESLELEVPFPVQITAYLGVVAENPGIVASTGDGFIDVMTQADGWETSPPFVRVHVMAHELVHVLHRSLVGGLYESTPLWLDEGLADYLGYAAVVDAGLVSAEAVTANHTALVVFGGDAPELSAMEDRFAISVLPAKAYSLAYLAAEMLLEPVGVAAVRTFYEQIAAGSDWRSAFAVAFERDPGEFYAAFGELRQELESTSSPEEYYPPAEFYPMPRPEDNAEEIEVVSLPKSISRGEQALFIARAETGATRCSMQVDNTDNDLVLDQPTYTDGTGMVFWLWSVPSDFDTGKITIAFACGADPVKKRITVT